MRNSLTGIGSSWPPFLAFRIALIALRRKLVTVTPGNRVRVLEGEEEPLLGADVGTLLDDRLPVEQDLALGDLVGGVTHQRVGEGRLAGPVRAHDRVLLVQVDGEVDALHDLGAVLERDMEVLQFQKRQACDSLFRSSKPDSALLRDLMVADRQRSDRAGEGCDRAYLAEPEPGRRPAASGARTLVEPAMGARIAGDRRVEIPMSIRPNCSTGFAAQSRLARSFALVVSVTTAIPSEPADVEPL